MTDRTSCRLVGAIRLTDFEDGIGIPLYSPRGTNWLCIGETDYDLRISRFVRFDDAAEYKIDYGVTQATEQHSYDVGDFTPIPYWLDNISHVLFGGIQLSELDHTLNPTAPLESVTADLRKIITRCRTGYYQSQMGIEQSASLAHEYSDIFDNYPVNSKYWVSRYRAAAARAATLPGNSAKEANEVLRQRAMEWLKTFQSKGNIRLFASVLTSSNESILTADEVRAMFARRLLDSLHNRKFSAFKRDELCDIIRRFCPEGIYYFYTWGKPELLTKLGASEFAYDSIWEGSSFDFAQFMNNFVHEDIWNNLIPALLVSTILYGTYDPPGEIAQKLYDLHTRRTHLVVDWISRAFKYQFRDRDLTDYWPSIALTILKEIDKLELMTRIREGALRLGGKLRPEQFRVDANVVAELKRYAKG